MPSSMLPGPVQGTEFLTEAEYREPALRAGDVYKTTQLLKHLAVMPIDKCQHFMLSE